MMASGTKGQQYKQCYSRYCREQAQRCDVHLECFRQSRALGEGHHCYSGSKNLQELYKCIMEKKLPRHSAEGDSTDYDTEGNTRM